MKNLLSLACCIVCTLGGYGQVKFAITPQTGATISNLSISLDADGIFAPPGEARFFNTQGAALGAGLNIQFNDWFSLQPEIQWIQKGFEPVDPIQFEDLINQVVFLDGRFVLNYIEIPLLARIKLGGHRAYLFLQGGPSIGIGFSGRYEEAYLERFNFGLVDFIRRPVKFGLAPEPNTTDNIFIEDRLDIGGQLGTGIGIRLGPGNLEFGIRYGFSFTDLFTPPNFPSSRNTYSNRYILTNIGYQIPLAKQEATRSYPGRPYSGLPNRCLRPKPRPKAKRR